MGIFLNRAGVASSNAQYTAGTQITTESFMYEDYVDDYSYAYADLMESIASFDSGVADSVVTEAAGGFGAAIGAFMNTVLGKVIVLIGIVIAAIIAFIAANNKDGGSGKSDDKKSETQKKIDEITKETEKKIDAMSKVSDITNKLIPLVSNNFTKMCTEIGNVSVSIPTISAKMVASSKDVSQQVLKLIDVCRELSKVVETMDKQCVELHNLVIHSWAGFKNGVGDYNYDYMNKNLDDDCEKFTEMHETVVRDLETVKNKLAPVASQWEGTTNVKIKDLKNIDAEAMGIFNSTANSAKGELTKLKESVESLARKGTGLSRDEEDFKKEYSKYFQAAKSKGDAKLNQAIGRTQTTYLSFIGKFRSDLAKATSEIGATVGRIKEFINTAQASNDLETKYVEREINSRYNNKVAITKAVFAGANVTDLQYIVDHTSYGDKFNFTIAMGLGKALTGTNVGHALFFDVIDISDNDVITAFNLTKKSKADKK